MSASKKRRGRKAYRPGRVAANPMLVATNNAMRLSPADVANQRRNIEHALTQLMAGREGDFHWSSLADTANVSEQLTAIGIGAGNQADQVIQAAQHALAALYRRHAERGTWAMHAAEVDALRWLIELHSAQLALCSYGEFERAYRATVERVSQALAGNAPRGAHVLVGLIDDRSAFDAAG